MCASVGRRMDIGLFRRITFGHPLNQRKKFRRHGVTTNERPFRWFLNASQKRTQLIQKRPLETTWHLQSHWAFRQSRWAMASRLFSVGIRPYSFTWTVLHVLPGTDLLIKPSAGHSSQRPRPPPHDPFLRKPLSSSFRRLLVEHYRTLHRISHHFERLWPYTLPLNAANWPHLAFDWQMWAFHRRSLCRRYIYS